MSLSTVEGHCPSITTQTINIDRLMYNITYIQQNFDFQTYAKEIKERYHEKDSLDNLARPSPTSF